MYTPRIYRHCAFFANYHGARDGVQAAGTSHCIGIDQTRVQQSRSLPSLTLALCCDGAIGARAAADSCSEVMPCSMRGFVDRRVFVVAFCADWLAGSESRLHCRPYQHRWSCVERMSRLLVESDSTTERTVRVTPSAHAPSCSTPIWLFAIVIITFQLYILTEGAHEMCEGVGRENRERWLDWGKRQASLVECSPLQQHHWQQQLFRVSRAIIALDCLDSIDSLVLPCGTLATPTGDQTLMLLSHAHHTLLAGHFSVAPTLTLWLSALVTTGAGLAICAHC